MRGFFLTLTILSLLATGGIFAWRTFAPEGGTVYTSAPSTAPAKDATRDDRLAARQERPQASQRQDWAMIASVASSIVSALAALLQAWFGARR